MRACAQCGRENPADARFCNACGAPLAAAAPAARRERKVVTALFADLVGFTSRAEQLDPEDVRALLEPYHARLKQELEHHGGTVEKFIGDAVMALFGAPVAHEDDAERAVRAALAIQAAVGGEPHVRVGVATGEALVTLDARPAEGEGMAAGDVVNTAARLQSAAPVDGVLVDDTTYRATRDAIVYREHEPVTAKGKAEPVVVWEAVEPRARLGTDVAHDARTALVGRERELGVLRDALARARAERAPQLVTLIGVPGIGKSRLVWELQQHVDADPELITWRQGRCLSYGEGIAFWALGEMVKAQAGLLETDTAEEAEAKLAETVAALVPAPEREWVRGHARPLAGLPGAGGSGRDEAFAAWRRLLEAMAEQRPAVLVFEDLHWADDGLLDFVDHLVDWAAEVPMLVVCTARPELLERRPAWGGGKLNAATLALSPLTAEDSARLVGLLLDQPLLPAPLQAALLERSEGNPLYAEQYVRMLADRGLLVREAGGWRLAGDEELPLPDTLQATIAARLDGLPPEEKLLLQDAAVHGKVFWLGALGETPALVERLHQLERKGFVRRARRSSVAAESEYAFAHALVRDVAYGQIPRLERARKHRTAAEWTERLAAERSGDHARTWRPTTGSRRSS
jgi:class 3 adenylate cyclase